METIIIPKDKVSIKRESMTAIASTIGGAVGLYMAYKGKKKFWGYVGRFFLWSIILGAGGSVVSRVVYPRKFDENGDAASTQNPVSNTTTTPVDKTNETTTK